MSLLKMDLAQLTECYETEDEEALYDQGDGVQGEEAVGEDDASKVVKALSFKEVNLRSPIGRVLKQVEDHIGEVWEGGDRRHGCRIAGYQLGFHRNLGVTPKLSPILWALCVGADITIL